MAFLSPLAPLAPSARLDAVETVGSVHVAFLEDRPFAEVIKKARAEKKPILLDVVASWCGPCKYMDKTTFSDASIVDWSKKTVVPARVDAEKGEGRKIAGRYAVRSFPTILFLDSSGNEIDRLSGALPAESFRANADRILAGKGPLSEAILGLKTQWSTEIAGSIALALAQRNDVPRLRPLVHRLMSEDPDLTGPSTLDAFASLVALEDFADKVSPETCDLILTYLPRLGADPRHGALATILAREFARRGDRDEARKLVTVTLKTLGEGSPYASDLQAALGAAEKKAGNIAGAVAAFKKASSLAEAASAAPSVRAARQLDLADGLVAQGKGAEAAAALKAGLERAGDDPGALARAARIKVLLKAPTEAVTLARRAVDLSHGDDAGAQAALAVALSASGDSAGAASAWTKAARIDPENPEYRRVADKPKKTTVPPKAS